MSSRDNTGGGGMVCYCFGVEEDKVIDGVSSMGY